MIKKMSIYGAIAAAIPAVCQAELVEIDDAGLSDISGQAWVVEIGAHEITVPTPREVVANIVESRDIPVGEILGKIEERIPRIYGVLEALHERRAARIEAREERASFTLSAGELSAFVPVLGRLPTISGHFVGDEQ